MRTQLTKSIGGLLIAGLLALPNFTQAQPSAHYVPGVEGIKGATLPPPGLWLRDYNVFYYADTLNDPNGNKVNGVDAKAFIYANVPRLLWITDTKVLGGYLGLDALCRSSTPTRISRPVHYLMTQHLRHRRRCLSKAPGRRT